MPPTPPTMRMIAPVTRPRLISLVQQKLMNVEVAKREKKRLKYFFILKKELLEVLA